MLEGIGGHRGVLEGIGGHGGHRDVLECIGGIGVCWRV